MENGAVLNGSALANEDGGVVGSYDSSRPNGRVSADSGLADYDGIGVDVGIGVNVGHEVAQCVDRHGCGFWLGLLAWRVGFCWLGLLAFADQSLC